MSIPDSLIIHYVNTISGFPWRSGNLIFTDQERKIFVDSSTGRVPYADFIVKETLLELQSEPKKFPDKIYCIADTNQLFRWTGVQLVEVGSAVVPLTHSELNDILDTFEFPRIP